MKSDPRDQSNHNCLLKQLISNFGQRLKSVVLFGSQARGEAMDTSDHNLFLVIDSLLEGPIRYLKNVRLVLGG
ncbi:hypothetical protein CMK14_24885 [Candidatus Poribacteria bacterium]|nr:hypothetical protein [Candidatus Poribacteria bacterium]